MTENFALVTNNGRDFRRLYAQIELHPGLVILLPSVSTAEQIRLLDAAIEGVRIGPDLVNKLIEVDAEGGVKVVNWPAP